MRKTVTLGIFIASLTAAGFAFLIMNRNIEINPAPAGAENETLLKEKTKTPAPPPPPKPLENPPQSIKAIYATSWSAGTPAKINNLIALIDATELNAIVIDIKDYSGYVGYKTNVADVKNYGAEEIRIADIDSLVRRLHEKGIYAIARVTIFQDPRLSLARPDLAVKNSATGKVWQDNKGLSWMDPASKIVWDYNINIIRDILSHGFDEINLDYIRFPSDGNLQTLQYPFWDGLTPKREVIAAFYRYLRKELPGVRLSADLFGQATVNYDDLGIGQVIEDAYEGFDYVSPMVYPSHYAANFLNLSNPAAYPYEVVKYSMDEAFKRLRNYELGSRNNGTSTAGVNPHYSKLRPWLQAFDLGAIYTPEMVQKEIRAVYDAARALTAERSGGQASSTSELLDGFMLWNAGNNYDKRALLPE